MSQTIEIAPSAPADTPMPSHMGGVRIQRVLGQGGMGRVYLGHHETLDVPMAVKVMRDANGEVERFLSEARLAARIKHENIVQIHHAGQEDGRLFIVMEFIDGQNLKQIVREKGAFAWRDAAHLILQAARGLAVVHRAGIVHRDVKPSNMLITANGVVKISDLGVAREIAGASMGTCPDQPVGTPAYMAPEQVRDSRQVGPAADVYSLGVSLYHLIAGTVPFQNRGFTGVLLAHINEPVPDIRRQVADIPANVADLLMRMMAKDPAQRPPHAGAVVAELERMLGLASVSTETMTLPRSFWHQTRIHWWRPAAALFIMGTATLALVPNASATSPITTRASTPVGDMAQVPAQPAAIDTWQSPPRSIFILSDHLPVSALNALDEACRATGLPVIERQRIDTLAGEQTLTLNGRIDPNTASRVGRLLGGHIAVFASQVDDQIEVRTVLVETGEIITSKIVAPPEVKTTASAGITQALSLVAKQGRIRNDHGHAVVSLGLRHGIHQGDRLELRRDRQDGPLLATAMVTAVEPDQAQIVIEPAQTDCQGALAIAMKP